MAQPSKKRQKVVWATTRGESDEEEEAAALVDFKAKFPVPEAMAAAASRAAAAAAEAAAAAPAAVFNKRKAGNKAGTRKK